MLLPGLRQIPLQAAGDDVIRDSRAGCVVVVAGPDGSGKTTLSDALERGLGGRDPVLRFHHRFGLLPAAGGPLTDVTQPHRAAPYPVALSWLKSLYLFADYLLGWALRVRPCIRHGGWVILERGWWDLLVDQRRYRLQRSAMLLGLLGRLLPQPDLVVVLHAPSSVLLARKAELPREEIERQLRLWRRVLPKRVRRAFLDCSEPLDDVALRECIDTRSRKRRVALNSGRR
jgi:thymidylate kinase